MVQIKFLLTAFAVATLAACGGGGGGSAASPVVSVSGIATKGLINKGNIEVLLVDASGSLTSFKKYEAITDAGGNYVINDVPAGSTVVLKVTATPGTTTLIDEATGTTIDAPSDLLMQSGLKLSETAGATNSAVIDVFSNMAVEQVKQNGGVYTSAKLEAANAAVGNQFGVNMSETPVFSADGTKVQNNRAAKLAQVAEVIKDSAAATALGCTGTDVSIRTSCVVKSVADSFANKSVALDTVISKFNDKQATVESKVDTTVTLTLAKAKTKAEIEGTTTASTSSETTSATATTTSTSTSTSTASTPSSTTNNTSSTSATSGSSTSTSTPETPAVPVALTDVEQAQKFFKDLRADLLTFKDSSNATNPSLVSMLDKIQADVQSRSKLLNGQDIEPIILASKIAGFLDDMKYSGRKPTNPTATGAFLIDYIDNVAIYCSAYVNESDALASPPKALTQTEINANADWNILACRNPKRSYNAVVDNSTNSVTARFFMGHVIFMKKSMSDTYDVNSITRKVYEKRVDSQSAWVADTNVMSMDSRPAAYKASPTYSNMAKAKVSVVKTDIASGYYKNVIKYNFSGDLSPSLIQNSQFSTYQAMYSFSDTNDITAVEFVAENTDTSSLSGISTSKKLSFSGSLAYKDKNLKTTSKVELLPGTLMNVVNAVDQDKGYDSQILKIKATTYDGSENLMSTIQGEFAITDYKKKVFSGNTYYDPTKINFTGTFKYQGIGSAVLDVTAEAKNYADYNPNLTETSTNIAKAKFTVNGTVLLDQKTPLNVNVVAVKEKIDERTLTLTYNASQDPTFWTLTATRNLLDTSKNTFTWSNSYGLTMTVKGGDTSAELKKNGATVGIYSQADNKITYSNGLFEKF
jgi:hypothetical protein